MYVSYFILLLILYIYIFNPVFIFPGFGLNNILLLLAGINCILKPNVYIRNIKSYKIELRLIIAMILYLIIVIAMSGTDYYKGVLDLLGFLTTLLFLPIFIVNSFLRYKKEIGFLNTIINVGLVAAIISILCMIIPSFNTFIRGIQTGVEMESVDELGLNLVRSFGLGGNLTSAYGYMMGLLSALCLLKMYETKKWYYLPYSIVFLVATIINARTGAFPFFIVLVFLFFKSIRLFNIIYLSVIVTVIIIVTYSFYLIKTINPDMYDYLYVFFDFLTSSDNFEDSAYSRMWFMPDSLQGLVFGEGRNVFGVEDNLQSPIGTSSDIGFIRNIFLGGIVFLVLLMLEQFVLYKNMYKRSGKDIFILVLSFSVLIFHYKGCLCYTTAAVSRFVMLYYFVLVYNKNSHSPILIFNRTL